MNNEVIYSGQYGNFYKGKGFLEKETLNKIVETLPVIKSVSNICDSNGDKVSCEISFELLNHIGEKREKILKLSSLHNIHLFRDLEIIEPFLTRKKEQLVWAEVFHQYNSIEHKTIYREKPGYYDFSEDSHVLIIGKHCFCANQDEQINFVSDSCYDVETSRDVIHMECNPNVHKIISFMPGLTEILFFSSILGAVKPILSSMGVVVDFMLLINGRSGSLKTTLTRRIALWEKDKAKQELSFSTSMSSDVLEKKIISHAASNILLDDFHSVPRDYTKKKYLDRLDIAARTITNSYNTAMVFVTAEMSPKDSIFSVLDRILEVKVPSMDSDKLLHYKKKLSDFPDDEMQNIVLRFAKNLMVNYDAVKADVKEFLKNNYREPDWIDNKMRVGNIRFVMLLVSHLFDKWCYKLENTDRINFESLLDNSLMKQTKKLQQIECEEKGYDVFQLLYDLVQNNGDKNSSFKLIDFLEEEKYEPESPQNAFTDGRTLKITTPALEYYLTGKIGHPVGIKKVSRILHDSGVLVESCDSRTKRFKSHRHFVIIIVALQKRVESYSNIETDENMTK